MVNTIYSEVCQEPVIEDKNKCKSLSLSTATLPLKSIDEKNEESAKPNAPWKLSTASLYTTKIVTINWNQLHDVEYFTKGGSSIIHTAFYNGRDVVVKTINPDIENEEIYNNDIENELNLLSRFDHPNIIKVYGGGYKKGKRFLVLERLDGGILSQVFEKQQQKSSSNKFWKSQKKQDKDSSSLLSIRDALKQAHALADALHYCHDSAVPGCMVLHRDLKPGNVGLTSDGKIKLFDFGLARMLEGASSVSNKVYKMSGKTGSLRYMAPEVVNNQPYNYKVDVYSFGIILWELLSNKKSFLNYDNEDEFVDQVVRGNKRLTINHKLWPPKLIKLMNSCWDVDSTKRPAFSKIVDVLDTVLIDMENNDNSDTSSSIRPRLMRRNSMPARFMPKRLSLSNSLEIMRRSSEKDELFIDEKTK